MVLKKEDELIGQSERCKWFGKRFGGYNCCIACARAEKCSEATGDK